MAFVCFYFVFIIKKKLSNCKKKKKRIFSNIYTTCIGKRGDGNEFHRSHLGFKYIKVICMLFFIIVTNGFCFKQLEFIINYLLLMKCKVFIYSV